MCVLRHAATSLLRPGGAMIPAGAEVRCVPVLSPELRPRLALLDDDEAAGAFLEARRVANEFFAPRGDATAGAATSDAGTFEDRNCGDLAGPVAAGGSARLHGMWFASLAGRLELDEP